MFERSRDLIRWEKVSEKKVVKKIAKVLSRDPEMIAVALGAIRDGVEFSVGMYHYRWNPVPARGVKPGSRRPTSGRVGPKLDATVTVPSVPLPMPDAWNRASEGKGRGGMIVPPRTMNDPAGGINPESQNLPVVG